MNWDSLSFEQRVWQIVCEIPAGKVLTYGRIAVLAGSPRGWRQAARAVHYAPPGIPCHRVVNSQGRTAPPFLEQRSLLEQEGVVFQKNGLVNLKQYLWK
ncbi:MAG: MGMT family protein [Massiliimalia sp.]|jgi:methylated-DNA-protein-cysteine methyltransferase-like protein